MKLLYIYYYNNTILELNFNTVNIIDNENNVNKNTNINSNNTKISLSDKHKFINKYSLKYLTELPLNKILNYYVDNDKLGDNLEDIYYYINHYNKSNKKEGKHSKNFNNKYKISKDI